LRTTALVGEDQSKILQIFCPLLDWLTSNKNLIYVWIFGFLPLRLLTFAQSQHITNAKNIQLILKPSLASQ